MSATNQPKDIGAIVLGGGVPGCPCGGDRLVTHRKLQFGLSVNGVTSGLILDYDGDLWIDRASSTDPTIVDWTGSRVVDRWTGLYAGKMLVNRPYGSPFDFGQDTLSGNVWTTIGVRDGETEQKGASITSSDPYSFDTLSLDLEIMRRHPLSSIWLVPWGRTARAGVRELDPGFYPMRSADASRYGRAWIDNPDWWKASVSSPPRGTVDGSFDLRIDPAIAGPIQRDPRFSGRAGAFTLRSVYRAGFDLQRQTYQTTDHGPYLAMWEWRIPGPASPVQTYYRAEPGLLEITSPEITPTDAASNPSGFTRELEVSTNWPKSEIPANAVIRDMPVIRRSSGAC